MKAWFVIVFLVVASGARAQQGPPDLPFESVPDFFKLPPGMNFGEVSGVAVNSKGHIFVFTRIQHRTRAGLRASGGAAPRVRPERCVRS